MDVKEAMELIRQDGKTQFENTAKVLADVTKNLGTALEEVNKASQLIERLHYRIDDLTAELTRREDALIAEEAAEEELENADLLGVPEIVILSFAVMWICLCLSVLRRWLRYRIWDKHYLQQCCKSPEFLAKLNFPLKGCGCPRWKYCQCVVPRPNEVPDGGSDLIVSSADGSVTPCQVKTAKDL